jgi:hypothetical protein
MPSWPTWNSAETARGGRDGRPDGLRAGLDGEVSFRPRRVGRALGSSPCRGGEPWRTGCFAIAGTPVGCWPVCSTGTGNNWACWSWPFPAAARRWGTRWRRRWAPRWMCSWSASWAYPAARSWPWARSPAAGSSSSTTMWSVAWTSRRRSSPGWPPRRAGNWPDARRRTGRAGRGRRSPVGPSSWSTTGWPPGPACGPRSWHCSSTTRSASWWRCPPHRSRPVGSWPRWSTTWCVRPPRRRSSRSVPRTGTSARPPTKRYAICCAPPRRPGRPPPGCEDPPRCRSSARQRCRWRPGCPPTRRSSTWSATRATS